MMEGTRESIFWQSDCCVPILGRLVHQRQIETRLLPGRLWGDQEQEQWAVARLPTLQLCPGTEIFRIYKPVSVISSCVGPFTRFPTWEDLILSNSLRAG